MADGDKVWTITGQRQTTVIGDNGRLSDVVEVTYRVPSIGFVGKVYVPVETFNPDTVKTALDAASAAHVAVHNL